MQDLEKTATAKRDVRALNHVEHAQQANDVIPSDLKHHTDLASEKGASSWLSVLPIGMHTRLPVTQRRFQRRPIIMYKI